MDFVAMGASQARAIQLGRLPGGFFHGLACNGEFAGGRATHKDALDAMKGRWKHPLKGMGWYNGTKKAFAALPED